MRARVAVLALVCVVSSACTPALGGDARYGCARTGRCPSSAPFCHADGLCRAMPEADGGAPDSGPPDAGWADPYRSCTDTCAADGEECLAEDAMDLGRAGYCTRPCAADEDCPPFLGAASRCGPTGRCLRGCSGAGDCAFPLECVHGRWSGATSTPACVTFDLSTPLETYSTCTSDGACDRPLSCIGGRCLRDCAEGGSCAFAETCVAAPDGRSGCLFECDGDPTVCDGTSAPCSASSRCTPAGW